MDGIGGPRVPGGRAPSTDPDARVQVVMGLLERQPDALLAAIGGGSSPRMVPIPDSLSGHGQPVIADGQSLEIIAPSDRAVVPRVWGGARVNGVAAATIGLVDEPGRTRRLYIFDLTPTHGVFMGILATNADSEAEALMRADQDANLAPRLAHVTKDAAAMLVTVSPELTSILGWRADEMVGRRMSEFVHPDDFDHAVSNWLGLLDQPGVGARVRLRHRHRNGSWVWMEVTNHNRLEDPEHQDVLAEMLDISEEMSAHEALRAREQLLAQMTETVPLGLFHVDLAGTLLYCNGRFQEITSVPLGAGLVAHLAQSLGDDRAALEAAMDQAVSGLPSDLEATITSGSPPAERHCMFSVRPLFDEAGTVVGLTGSVEDITDSIQVRRELEVKAATDPLTGCLNRTATLGVLQELLDRTTAPGAGSATAVVFVDLDRFKPVNDHLGHAVGDELLQGTADRIVAAVRSSDMVGRLGGDEFVVVCPGVASPSDALRIARSVAARVCGPLELRSGSVEVRASFGVAWCDMAGTPAANLIDMADAAMYRSKAEGRCEPVLAAALDE